jgi:Protein of unknown function (DUF3300)
MLQSLRYELAGARGAILTAMLSGLLAAPIGCSSSDTPPPPSAATTQAATQPAPQAAAGTPESATLTKEQLEALVAPIALYPDPLLAQCLVASTYPLDIVAAQQWLNQNSNLKGEELSKAAEQQKWDPSVQALVLMPEALKRLSENISWTTDLGDAFLAQENQVMDAVQALRAKARDEGKLQTTEQQTVETKTVESKTVVEIQPASTEVVYVPTYSPSVIWGPMYYPYPPLYYPPYYGGAWLGFGVGIAIGIGISGGWGWGCGWGGNNTININNNNNFVNHYNRTNNINRSGNSNWQHNAQQRGGTPYKDRATASKYGGGSRGDSMQTRQSGASQRQTQASRGGASTTSRGSGSNNYVGNRNVSPSTRSSGAFGGSQSGNWARSTSSRGASSMGGMRGGGGGRRR